LRIETDGSCVRDMLDVGGGLLGMRGVIHRALEASVVQRPIRGW
jgi:hypothetical protein